MERLTDCVKRLLCHFGDPAGVDIGSGDDAVVVGVTCGNEVCGSVAELDLVALALGKAGRSDLHLLDDCGRFACAKRVALDRDKELLCGVHSVSFGLNCANVW